MHPTREPSARVLLLIEDNEAEVRLWREALRELAAPVTLAAVASGSDALDYLHRRGEYAGAALPDLVVMDLHLLDGSGLDVLATMRESDDERIRHLPVIVATGLASPAEQGRAKQLGAAAVFTKSSSLDDLLLLVQQIQNRWLGSR